mmetsp:Transcript_98304/g.211999  ORF Transcript_98304/g.211999 Transcript_98304/m.211999 type:complete len:233 (-) Transcript_98304:838-1536(-)|eukprot:CAMPEP_0116949432 /NCGR_PEP_ID=MMETSP0467-20121206/38886_1 /TAXON_ID=283647 /ORGANISM="Mesodinium pulex, Strain SPMC105" /LENGTH=232 /DNA_ID=CAMNT_0004634017 /DNA_START=133 /DNA_END=831 /DNA_ORIENTATION=-
MEINIELLAVLDHERVEAVELLALEGGHVLVAKHEQIEALARPAGLPAHLLVRAKHVKVPEGLLVALEFLEVHLAFELLLVPTQILNQVHGLHREEREAALEALPELACSRGGALLEHNPDDHLALLPQAYLLERAIFRLIQDLALAARLALQHFSHLRTAEVGIEHDGDRLPLEFVLHVGVERVHGLGRKPVYIGAVVFDRLHELDFVVQVGDLHGDDATVAELKQRTLFD